MAMEDTGWSCWFEGGDAVESSDLGLMETSNRRQVEAGGAGKPSVVPTPRTAVFLPPPWELLLLPH